MKDLFFAADLLTVFRHDTYYGDYKNISVALRKVGLAAVKRTDSIDNSVGRRYLGHQDGCRPVQVVDERDVMD